MTADNTRTKVASALEALQELARTVMVDDDLLTPEQAEDVVSVCVSCAAILAPLVDAQRLTSNPHQTAESLAQVTLDEALARAAKARAELEADS
jgi:hypothetical protein